MVLPRTSTGCSDLSFLVRLQKLQNLKKLARVYGLTVQCMFFMFSYPFLGSNMKVVALALTLLLALGESR